MSSVDKSGLGKALGAFDEARRKKLQNAVVEAMFALAEKKYGKKRPVRETDKRDPMADFELYLRSVKAKVKTAEDKLAGILRQKKELDTKLEAAQKEHDDKKKVADGAEAEKAAAVKDSRDPVLPKDFIIPKKLGAKKMNLTDKLMKASATSWEDKFAKMSSKKTSAGPAWKKKTDRTAVLVGSGGGKKKKDQPEPAFALKKGAPKKDDAGGAAKKSAPPAAAAPTPAPVVKAPEPEPAPAPAPVAAPAPAPEPEPEPVKLVMPVEEEEADDGSFASRRRRKARQRQDSD